MARKKKQRASSKKKTAAPAATLTKGKDSKIINISKKGAVSAENFFKSLSKYSRWIEICALVAIIVTGVLFRLEDLSQWQNREQKAFFDNQPLHTTFDAWFYLSLAKDIAEDTYYPIDEKRGVPDSPPRPSPPPLISCLTAVIAKTTSFSMSWIGAILPPLLGPLLAIPLFLLGRYYGGPIMGLSAALMALLYPFYVYRSNVGRFDTDCMNVTWAACAAYLFLRFGILETKKRYIYLLGGFIVYALFLWWWDQTPAVVGAITFLPLAVALALFYRPPKKEAFLLYGGLGAGVVILLAVNGIAMPVKILQSIWHQYLYITKDASGDFPNIGLTISEQSRPSFDLVLGYTTKNILAFVFSVAGIILLVWKRFKDALFLLSLIILSIMAVTTANRFLIFLIPILALGAGFSLSMLWGLRKQFTALTVVCPVLILCMCIPLYKANSDYVQWPKESAPIIAGMDTAKKKTPSDAVIWAWWDHGYALTYYARRATINDGSIHSGERTVYTGIPLATDSFQLAANFMQFYVIRGMKGIKKLHNATDDNPGSGLTLLKKILRAGPDKGRALIAEANLKPVGNWKTVDDWLRFFYPPEKRPVYLFVDNLLTKTSYWWHWFGTWDMQKQEGLHPVYQPFYNVKKKGGMIRGTGGLQINMETGDLYTKNNRIKISNLLIRKKKDIKEQNYGTKKGYRFEMLEQARYGALMDARISESVFNKLFIRHIFPKKYFRPVEINSPFYQLWEVRGDSLPDAA